REGADQSARTTPPTKAGHRSLSGRTPPVVDRPLESLGFPEVEQFRCRTGALWGRPPGEYTRRSIAETRESSHDPGRTSLPSRRKDYDVKPYRSVHPPRHPGDHPRIDPLGIDRCESSGSPPRARGFESPPARRVSPPRLCDGRAD